MLASLSLAHPASVLTVVGILYLILCLCVVWQKGGVGVFSVWTMSMLLAMFFYAKVTSDPNVHNSRGPHPYDQMYQVNGEWVSQHELLYERNLDPPRGQDPVLRRDIGGRAVFFHPGCFLWVAVIVTPIYVLMLFVGLNPLSRKPRAPQVCQPYVPQRPVNVAPYRQRHF